VIVPTLSDIQPLSRHLRSALNLDGHDLLGRADVGDHNLILFFSRGEDPPAKPVKVEAMVNNPESSQGDVLTKIS